MNPATALSWETPRPGLRLAQPTRGFRYGAEAYWLAGLAIGERPRRALDLGTGCGVIAWMLASHGVQADGIDAEPAWRPYWDASLADATAPPGVRLVCADAATWSDGPYDVITANPPYFLPTEGPVPADALRRAARVVGPGTLEAFGAAIRRCLAPQGVAFVSLPPARCAAFASACGDVRVTASWRPAADRSVLALTRDGRGCAAAASGEADQSTVASWYAAARSPSVG